MTKFKPTFRAAPVRVRVPATSANLGPGFDALGLALSLYDDVVVRVTDEGLTVDVAGMGAATVARNARNLVVRSMRAAFEQLGGRPRGLEVVCANRVPHSRGLGSSAAAIVAGVVAARALVVGGTEKMDDDQVLRLAASIEGHPDNVAACLRGGLTLAWTDADGGRAVDLDVSADLAPVVLVPGSSSSSTKATRKLLPETVPHGDAVHAATRTALLVEALRRRPELLLTATDDRLHQPYRAEAMPRTAELVAELRTEGIPAVVSGAGPTVLALTTASTRAEAMRHERRGWSALPLDVDTDGAVLLPL
jgi:homoserine kinase